MRTYIDDSVKIAVGNGRERLVDLMNVPDYQLTHKIEDQYEQGSEDQYLHSCHHLQGNIA